MRAKVIEIKQLPFIQAQRALGQTTPVILMKYVLPHLSDVVLMRATLSVSSAMLTEARLRFLGLGALHRRSWGAMLYYAFGKNAVVAGYTWWYVPPILCISLCIFSLVLLGYYGLDPQRRVRMEGSVL